MKKFLLLIFLTITLTSYAQTSNRVRHNNGDWLNSVNVIPIGQAINAFGSLRNNTQLWYDRDINTVSFTHRSVICDSINYDFSIDGGVTWPSNQIGQGCIYRDTTATNCFGGTLRARYPGGLIYNPPGNTTVGNAFVTSFGPISDGTNWVGVYEGSLPIGGSMNQQNFYSCLINYGQLIPSGFQVIKNTGIVWASSEEAGCGGNSSVDTIILSKGVYNATSHGFDYTFSKVPLGLTTSLGTYYDGHNMAWSDDGQSGYIVVIGNDSTLCMPDSVYYPIIYKTSDGGITWTHLHRAPNINLLNALLPANPMGTIYSSDYEVDAVVDKNNNLHCIVKANPNVGNGSIDIAPTHWGLFDIYTTDGGTTWFGKLLDTPNLFSLQFGSGTSLVEQRNRGNATRSWDGSKLFFSWYDSVPSFNGINWRAMGYDVDLDRWTPIFNFTTGTSAAGVCYFGTSSYYSINHGLNECIPMVYLAFSATPIDPVVYYYVDGACISQSDYTNVGGSVLLNCFGVGINDFSKGGFSVSSNYPNPFSGSTMVDVTLTNPADLAIEISNMLGLVLSKKVYKNLNAGKNQLTIDASNFASGIYVYKVKVGNETVARIMYVK